MIHVGHGKEHVMTDLQTLFHSCADRHTTSSMARDGARTVVNHGLTGFLHPADTAQLMSDSEKYVLLPGQVVDTAQCVARALADRGDVRTIGVVGSTIEYAQAIRATDLARRLFQPVK